MSKPFDASLKALAGSHPGDYLTLFDQPPTLPVSVLNVDLSTVTTSGDLVIGLGEPLQEILHLDFQAGPDADKPRDLLAYNALLHRHYRVAVHSLLVLLRREAHLNAINGLIRYAPRPRRGRMEYGFELIRLWQWPVERLLRGPLGTLPLAVLGQLPDGVELTDGLREVVAQMLARVQAETEEGQGKQLLTAAFVLSGLRLDVQQAQQVFRGVRAMRESTTYIAILNEGIEKGREQGREQGIKQGIEQGNQQRLRKDILNLCKQRKWRVSRKTQQRLEAITDLKRLERMFDRILEASDWDDLLGTP